MKFQSTISKRDSKYCQTMRVLLLAASAYALDALHALLDSHPRGLRKVAVAHTSYGRGLVAKRKI